MVKALLIAGLVIAVLSTAAVAEDLWYPWWDRTPNVTYLWDDWTNCVGVNSYAPDSVGATGAGVAEVVAADTGAGLMEGSWDGFGPTRTNFWDLGPGGAMHIDLNSNPNGMLFWVQVTYHEGMAVAPAVSINGAQQVALSSSMFELRQIVEDTGDVGTAVASEPTGWVTYMSLWRLNPGVTFSGIDIIADGDMGSIVDSVVVDARVLPEPTAVVLALVGNCALFGWRRYRR